MENPFAKPESLTGGTVCVEEVQWIFQYERAGYGADSLIWPILDRRVFV